jgi:hypothetical protein
VPAPPDFGGAIDVFYKMKALYQLGIKIIMHCFEYKRSASDDLKNYCEEVYYYPRKTGLISQFSFVPYIVNSRQCPDLLERLIKDNYPVLYEGLHTIAYLGHPALKGKKQWVRAHNIEHDYYNSLFHAEKQIHKKMYYKLEAWKLKRFNSNLALADGIFAISQSDAETLINTNSNTCLIPAFNGYSEISSTTKKGEYILYHGDLSVAENNRSAEFMIDVCKDLPYRLIIAGKDPQNQLIHFINQYHNFKLIENPTEDEMKQLIQNAGVILLPAKQKTGLRLKLLASLFMGQHCIASPEMVISTGLEKLCHLAENKEEWQQTIKLCMNTSFTQYHIKQRQEPLKVYCDVDNAKEIVRLMF